MNTQQEKKMSGIIRKLGFDPRSPRKKGHTRKEEWTCDDSKINPFSKLTLEEKYFLEAQIFSKEIKAYETKRM